MDQQSTKAANSDSSLQSTTTGKKKQDRMIGTKINERYEILSVVGHGATTSVYKAQDTKNDRLVAIKMLHTHSVSSEMTVRRFEQECKTLALLRHVNIVSQYESGVTDQDQPFLVMEFLEGASLMQMIQDNGAIRVIPALSIFTQACAGLAAAHEKGVVHRDMKPANIMLIKDDLGRDLVKILDFGVAKLLIQGETFQTKTQTGEMLGTLLYMSPEQCLDQDLDGRSDVYSLGCVLFEALTGKPPICGRTAFETMNQHLTVKPAKLSSVRPDLVFPLQLEKIVQKAVEKDPKLRYQRISDFEDALKELLMQIELAPPVHEAPKAPPLPPRPLPPSPPESELSLPEEEALINFDGPESDIPFATPPGSDEQDRSREGTIDFLATESMDGAPWQRIYSDLIKTYSISTEEVLRRQDSFITQRYNVEQMEKFALEKFSTIDKNSDGFISKEELTEVLRLQQGWREAHFVDFLLKHLDEIRTSGAGRKWPASASGISRRDIATYFGELKKGRSAKIS